MRRDGTAPHGGGCGGREARLTRRHEGGREADTRTAHPGGAGAGAHAGASAGADGDTRPGAEGWWVWRQGLRAGTGPPMGMAGLRGTRHSAARLGQGQRR